MAQFRTDLKILDGPHNRTRYEVMMLNDRLTTSGSLTDAFGRLRTSTPFTLFDSQHRYKENDKFDTLIVGATANSEYKINESAINLNVGTSSGDKVVRESKRVFAYQPGKSLLIMNTFVMNEPKAHVRQRVGYFGNNNGIYLEANGVNISLVKRSYSSGTIEETVIPQSSWNIDKFDGKGLSGQMSLANNHGEGLLVNKSNLFWIDMEWLGVGDVRCGFLVDGGLYPAHVFHHDNVANTTYITTAVLPIRYEIENLNTAGSSSTLKQICSTVISEGGYQGRNRARSHPMDLGNFKTLAAANTYYPVMSIRLNPDRPDAVVLPKNFDLGAITNQSATLHYKILINANLSNTSFANCQGNTVQFDISANSTFSGGTLIKSGYISTSQKGTAVDIGSIDEFEIQLGRTISGNSDVFSLIVASETSGVNVGATIEWFELI